MEYDLQEAKTILSKTPSILETQLTGIAENWIMNNEGDNTWSPYDVIGHFIHGEKTDWIPRAKIIINDGTSRPFESFDRYAQFTASKGKSIPQLLDEFATLRQTNLEQLDSLNITEEKLALKGIHPDFGEVSLKQLLATWVVHDLTHIAQINRVMAKQYKEAVGPWVNYLTILQS